MLYDRNHYIESELEVALESNMNTKLVASGVRISSHTFPAINATLTCLVDLTENSKTLAHLQAWRGRCLDAAAAAAVRSASSTLGPRTPLVRQTGGGLAASASGQKSQPPVQRSTARLLCELWRAEEMRLGVLRDPETGVQYCSTVLYLPRSCHLCCIVLYSAYSSSWF